MANRTIDLLTLLRCGWTIAFEGKLAIIERILRARLLFCRLLRLSNLHGVAESLRP